MARPLVRIAHAALFVLALVGPGCPVPEEAAGPTLLESVRGLGLADTFDAVAAAQGVPRELLLAAAWHQSSFDPLPDDHDDDAPEHAPSHGWLGLSPDQVEQAAALSGLPAALVADDPQAGLVAGAALLAALAEPGALASEPGAPWWPAVVALSGLDEEFLAHGFALDVFTTVQEGLEVEAPDGSLLAFAGRDLPDLEDVDVVDGPMEEDGDFAGPGDGFPGRARFLPAHSSNYTSGRSSSIRRVVLHTTEGSYDGAIGWFRNPSSNVSAHYVVRRSDGQITQMVRDNATAWHACSANSDTIGIEHEGRASVRSTWTTANLDASARLVGWLTRAYNIPVDRQHIVAHGEVQPSYCAYRYDPGPHFPWAAYMKKVRYYKQHGWRAAGAGPKAKIELRLPTDGQQVGMPFVMQATQKRAHHLAVYLGARRVAKGLRGNVATVVVRPQRPGWKRLQVRAYRADGSENGRKTIRVRARTSSVDVAPRANHLDGLDYTLTTTADGPAAYVRYWVDGRTVRDKRTDRVRARPDDYLFVRTFGSEARRLLVARAYRDDGRLIGEGWRWVRPEDRPGEPLPLSNLGADELVGQTMRLHADADPDVAYVRYFSGGEALEDVDTGEVRAYAPDFDLYVDFDAPGARTLTARAYDLADNVRDTASRTIHVPSWTLQVGWERIGERRYRFDADPPAGTDRVLFYRGSTLLLDATTGQGYAPGRAFQFEAQFASGGATGLSAVARDPLGNVLGSLTFSLDVQ